MDSSGIAEHQAAGARGSLSEEALDRLVYIIGTARGGTSVLFDALGVHDEILALPGMTHFMNQVWRYRNTIHMRLLRQIFRLPGFYDEEGVVRSLDQEEGRELRQRIDEALESRDLRRMWQLYPVVYCLDKRNTKRAGDIRAWADKANDFYAVEKVAQAFPQGRFVFIVRDPRGAVASLAKRMAVKEEHTFEAKIDDAKVIEAAVSWRRMTQQILRFRKAYPERSVLVTMEEFIANPVGRLNDLFEFTVGKRMPEDLLRRRVDELAYGTSHVPGDMGKGIRQEPVDRWKKVLTPEQEELVRLVTGGTGSKAGYPLEGRGALRGGLPRILRRLPSAKRKLVVLSKILFLRIFEPLI
jgi:hypothetical protein